jgi:hypothetical protein
MVPCGCRQNGAFASALAGMVPEKLANVAATTNAEPKRASFCIERLPGFSSAHVARTEFSLLQELQKACVVYRLVYLPERSGQSSNTVPKKNSSVSQLREKPQPYQNRKSAMMDPAERV